MVALGTPVAGDSSTSRESSSDPDGVSMHRSWGCRKISSTVGCFDGGCGSLEALRRL